MISKAAKKAEKQDNLQTVDKPIQFKNRVWGVAPSGVRAAAPHSAPARMPGVYAQRLCTMQSQQSIHSLSQGKGFGDRD